MLLNNYVLDTEKLDNICSTTFIVPESSVLFLYPSVFSIKHSRPAWVINSALSDFGID